MFDGVPNWPSPSRFWDVVARHRVTVLYTAPTAIRALEALGTQWVQGAQLGSLRLLGSVGEPINQEAWEWYHRWVGQGRCPVVDTWWQTETGGVLISGFGGLTPQRPTFATLPMPGIFPALLDDQGHELPLSPTQPTTGNLCIRRPWPGLARTTWADPQRFRNTYFTTYPGYYFTGDGALHAPEGLWRITGRVDDVINVSGHRIGTAEVEDVLNLHPQSVESAVVGFPHPIKGTALAAFAIPEGNAQAHPATLAAEAKALVAERIGPFARPDYVLLVPGLPKTRSGKIMRRILRKLAEDTPPEALGDTTTLLDPSIVAHIANAWAQRD
jgi:acetyl-CoA synthetase